MHGRTYWCTIKSILGLELPLGLGNDASVFYLLCLGRFQYFMCSQGTSKCLSLKLVCLHMPASVFWGPPECLSGLCLLSNCLSPHQQLGLLTPFTAAATTPALSSVVTFDTVWCSPGSIICAPME